MITKKISYKRIVILLVSLVTIPLTFYVSTKVDFSFKYYIQEKTFNEEKLISYLKKRRIRFPYIVLAQAKLESNGINERPLKPALDINLSKPEVCSKIKLYCDSVKIYFIIL